MDELNTRIITLMIKLGFSKTTFAKELDVSLPLITHIANGRNKPGLDIIQKIILRFEQINPEWLLNGKGEMFRMKAEKPDYTDVLNTIEKIKMELNEQKTTHETIKNYHKILIDEIKHLEELKTIIASSDEKLIGIVDELGNLRSKILSK